MPYFRCTSWVSYEREERMSDCARVDASVKRNREEKGVEEWAKAMSRRRMAGVRRGAGGSFIKSVI